MSTSTTVDTAEINAVARQMAEAYVQLVQFYVRERGLGIPDAHTEASRPLNARAVALLETQFPAETSWRDLQELMALDPQRATAQWEKIKDEAGVEWGSGQRAAEVLANDPFGRARFFAIRASFRTEWKPQSGIESTLIDTLAQLHSCYLFWLERFMLRATLDVADETVNLAGKAKWLPPRISDANALEQAAQMADRFNRLFLRTLRALRDLRRAGVIIHTGQAQVNIAAPGSQQLNVQEVTAMPSDSS